MELSDLCQSIGGSAISDMKKRVDDILARGAFHLNTGADAAYVLRLFTILVPTDREDRTELYKADQKSITGFWKMQGGRKVPGLVHPMAGAGVGVGTATYAPAATTATALRPLHSAAALPVQAPLVLSQGSLTLPLPTSAAKTGGGAKKSGGKGGSGKGSGGGRGSGLSRPPQPNLPTVRAAQELQLHNDKAQADQHNAAPGAVVCRKCKAENRTPYHRIVDCAWLFCHNCKRSGHKSFECVLPKYP